MRSFWGKPNRTIEIALPELSRMKTLRSSPQTVPGSFHAVWAGGRPRRHAFGGELFCLEAMLVASMAAVFGAPAQYQAIPSTRRC